MVFDFFFLTSSRTNGSPTCPQSLKHRTNTSLTGKEPTRMPSNSTNRHTQHLTVLAGVGIIGVKFRCLNKNEQSKQSINLDSFPTEKTKKVVMTKQHTIREILWTGPVWSSQACEHWLRKTRDNSGCKTVLDWVLTWWCSDCGWDEVLLVGWLRWCCVDELIVASRRYKLRVGSSCLVTCYTKWKSLKKTKN